MSERLDAALDAQHGGLDVDRAYTIVEATFSPPEWTRHTTLKPEAASVIGTRTTFEALWRLGEPDTASSPYTNDWAMRPYEDVHRYPFAWCRLSDLVDRKVIVVGPDLVEPAPIGQPADNEQETDA